MKKSPTGFIPTEDQGFIIFSVNLPPGASLDRTQHVMDKIEHLLNDVEAIDRRGAVTGLNIVANASSSNYAVGFIRMKRPGKRGKVDKVEDVMGVINQKLSVITEASVFLFQFPTVQGFGNTSGFEFILQDRTGGALGKLGATAYGFIGELMKRKEIAYAFTTFSTGNPQYMLNVKEDKAKQLGVSVSELLKTLQVYYGSSFASDFNRFGKYYRVIVQADVEYRKEPSSMNNVYVKNNLGEMVPINTLVSLDRVYGPETVTRNNLFNSVTINGMAKPGYSSGDAIKAIREVTAQTLVLDLAEAGPIDSAATDCLRQLAQRQRQRGGELHLIGLDEWLFASFEKDGLLAQVGLATRRDEDTTQRGAPANPNLLAPAVTPSWRNVTFRQAP